MEIRLAKSRIILRAKEEIYIAVHSHLSVLPVNADGKNRMEALEDDMHERKMLQMLGIALSEFKLALGNYAGQDTLKDGMDGFSLGLSVSKGIEETRAADLERLCEAYLIRRIVADWWLANYPEYMTPYMGECQAIITEITDILNMRRPVCNLHHVSYINPDGTYLIVLYKDEVLTDI